MEMTKVSSIILTPKQHKFCLKYVESGNASLAYREVYDCSGSKPTSVSRKAKELLDNGKITATINELSNMHQQRHQITIDSLSNQLMKIEISRVKMGIPRLPFQQQWVKHDCLVC